MTATHKNVNEDIRDEGDVQEKYTHTDTHTQTHRGSREGCENWPGQCSIEGKHTIKPTEQRWSPQSAAHSTPVLRRNTLTFW